MSISKVPWTRSLGSLGINGVSPERQEEEYASYTDCQEEEEIEGLQLFTVEWIFLRLRTTPIAIAAEQT